MALKRFRLALEDCQHAAALQSNAPSSKTLLRLARCQLALGATTPAATTINTVLTMEPNNTAAVQLHDKVHDLECHLDNFEQARKRKDWGHARLALDKCLQAIEGEGGELPTEWRIWRVELELCRKSWEAAQNAAKYAFKLHLILPKIFYFFQRSSPIKSKFSRRVDIAWACPIFGRETTTGVATQSVGVEAGSRL